MRHLFPVYFCLGALGEFIIKLLGSLQLPGRYLDVGGGTAVASCTKKWSPGTVTGIQSTHIICITSCAWCS